MDTEIRSALWGKSKKGAEHTNRMFMSLITAMLLFANSTASALVINAFDYGWYTQAGSHTPHNTNIWTGYNVNALEYRHFQAFDLASASANTITAATLTYFSNNGDFRSPQGTETIKISDFTSSIDDLLAGAGGVGAFADLGTGNIFGSATISQASNTSMPEITIVLNGFGLTALNAALASSDQRFVLGGALTTLDYTAVEAMFSGSGLGLSSMLDLTLGPQEMPTPATLALFGFGLAILGGRRAREHRQNNRS